jgi:transposase-like protein
MEQVTLSPRRPRRTSQQISALLAKYNTSGVAVSEFCKQHQIPRATFHKWISRSKQKAKPTTVRRSAFAKVEVTALPNTLFAEVNGIRIYQVVAASYLKELKG